MITRRKSLYLICGATLLPSAARSATFTAESPIMGTLFRIKTHTEDKKLAKKASAEAFAAAEQINAAASDYIADGELLSFSKLPFGKPHPVSETLFPLLQQAQRYALKTNGNFDPTLGPLTKLWRESRRRKSLPDAGMLSKALAASGFRKLILDEAARTLTFTVP